MISIRQYAPGEVIIGEHEQGDMAFLIETGRVEVTKEAGGKKVHLAFLGPQDTFGEMSMIDEKPRSATVTATEETTVREIHRDTFHALVREHPDEALKLIKQLFERLREANMALVGATSEPSPPTPHEEPKAPDLRTVVVSLEGLTESTVTTLPSNPFTFKNFPFRIGRACDDPLVNNHLSLPDSEPLQISRHHVSIVREGGRIGVVDRGSYLGATVDTTRIGGDEVNSGPIYFGGKEGLLVLGAPSSKYRYKVIVEWSS